MSLGIGRRLRTLAALVLFGASSGGAQLLDAVVFHRGPVRVEVARINSGDNCHGERCDLGAPIASPPPASPPGHGGRIEPPSTLVAVLAPVDRPRGQIRTHALGSRAPPLHS